MPDPHRVVITSLWADVTGGAERALWSWLKRGDRERIAPALILHRHGELVEKARDLGIPVAVVETGRFRELHRGAAAVRRMAALIRGRQPAAVVHWLHRAQVYGGPAAALAGVADRTMWWQLGLDSGVRPLDRVATAAPARCVVTCSEATARLQRSIAPRRPVLAVPLGIEPPRAVQKAELTALRRELDLPEAGGPVIGIVGRMQRWKNQDRFIDALVRLREAGHDVRGLVVGSAMNGIDAAYERELHAQVAAAGLERVVRFTGWVPDPTAHIKLMDVLVNASDTEPFGLVLVEGLAAGVPVVAVESAGPLEILEADRSGVFARSSRPADLAVAIGRVLGDRELRERLAARGPARYREHFSSARMVADFDAAVLAVAEGGLPAGARAA